MKKGSGRSRSRNKPLHTTEDVINLPRGFWPHSRDLFGKFRSATIGQIECEGLVADHQVRWCGLACILSSSCLLPPGTEPAKLDPSPAGLLDYHFRRDKLEDRFFVELGRDWVGKFLSQWLPFGCVLSEANFQRPLQVVSDVRTLGGLIRRGMRSLLQPCFNHLAFRPWPPPHPTEKTQKRCGRAGRAPRNGRGRLGGGGVEDERHRQRGILESHPISRRRGPEAATGLGSCP